MFAKYAAVFISKFKYLITRTSNRFKNKTQKKTPKTTAVRVILGV
jgi:hypothetical protein